MSVTIVYPTVHKGFVLVLVDGLAQHFFVTLLLRICSTLTFAARGEEPTTLLLVTFVWVSTGSFTLIHCNARTHTIAREFNCQSLII